jgi:hypothetical protein
MTILTLPYALPKPTAETLRHRLRRAWSDIAARRAERRALVRIARLGPRLMADIGVDPELTAVDAWDALLPNGHLVRRRR